MNLSKLFEAQKALDNHIIKEKHLEGQDLLPNKILALQVELGELANEWRGFKHWSNDRKPRRNATRIVRADLWPEVLSETENYDPLLEEYVDCLHFILSIGLDFKVKMQYVHIARCTTTHFQFQSCFMYASMLYSKKHYWELLETFAGLGEHLGFTGDEIEQAYMSKNAVNHQRQVNGY